MQVKWRDDKKSVQRSAGQKYKLNGANGVQIHKHKLNLEIPKSNQVSFGTKSLSIQGLKSNYLQI